MYLASGLGGGVQRMSAAEAVAGQIAGTSVSLDVTGYRAARFADCSGAEVPLRNGPYARPSRPGTPRPD